MKTKLIAPLFGVSFIVCAISVSTLGVLFWLSLAVLAATGIYIERHRKELEAELDELFGKDDELL